MSCETSESFHVNSQPRNVKISSKSGERKVSVLGDKHFLQTEPREIQNRAKTWKACKYSRRDCAWPRNFFKEISKVLLTEDTSWTLLWNTTWNNKPYTVEDGCRNSRQAYMLNGVVNCAVKWCLTYRFVVVC